MDAKVLLEQLLQSGRSLAEKGQNVAEEKLGIPAEGEQRDVMMAGMKKGALAAGALALLLGTRGGRALGGTALKLGSLAAVGGLAYKVFQEWQNQQGQTEVAADSTVKPVNELQDGELDARSTLLIRAMIAAAKADGHIDDAEKQRIDKQIADMGLVEGAADFITEELGKPLNIHEVVEAVNNPEVGVEVYLVSRMVVDIENAPEKLYLGSLAKALNLTPDLVARLDKVVSNA